MHSSISFDIYITLKKWLKYAIIKVVGSCFLMHRATMAQRGVIMKRLYNCLSQLLFLVVVAVGTVVVLYTCITVITTSVGLEEINSEIRSEQDYAGTLQGYTDTTKFNERIEELFEERREKYYESDNILVSKFSTQSALVKFSLFIVAVFVVVLFIAIVIVMIINALKAFWRFLARPFRR